MIQVFYYLTNMGKYLETKMLSQRMNIENNVGNFNDGVAMNSILVNYIR